MSKLKEVDKAPNVSDLSDQINVLRGDMRDITETITEIGKAKRDALGDKAKEQMDQVRTAATDGVDVAKAQIDQLNVQASRFVKEQPLAALGIAAGIGFLAGMLSNRRF